MKYPRFRSPPVSTVSKTRLRVAAQKTIIILGKVVRDPPSAEQNYVSCIRAEGVQACFLNRDHGKSYNRDPRLKVAYDEVNFLRWWRVGGSTLPSPPDIPASSSAPCSTAQRPVFEAETVRGSRCSNAAPPHVLPIESSHYSER